MRLIDLAIFASAFFSETTVLAGAGPPLGFTLSTALRIGGFRTSACSSSSSWVRRLWRHAFRKPPRGTSISMFVGCVKSILWRAQVCPHRQQYRHAPAIAVLAYSSELIVASRGTKRMTTKYLRAPSQTRSLSASGAPCPKLASVRACTSLRPKRCYRARCFGLSDTGPRSFERPASSLCGQACQAYNVAPSAAIQAGGPPDHFLLHQATRTCEHCDDLRQAGASPLRAV